MTRRLKTHSRALRPTHTRANGSDSRSLPIFRVLDSPPRVRVTLPGYGYDSLDRHGYVKLTCMQRKIEGIRMMLYAPDYSGLETDPTCEYQKLMNHVFQDKLILMIASVYRIYPSFYEKAHLFNNITSEDKIVNIGKSSYQHHNVVISDVLGEVLHESWISLVLADKTSRRPSGFSPRFNDYFKDKKVTIPVDKVVALEKPISVYSTNYSMRWSDTDFYKHTNHSNYVRICMDAMVEMALHGVFTELKGDIEHLRVKELKCFFQKETNPGDLLDIHVWENKISPYVLHAIVERCGESVFQCTVEFIPENICAKL